MTRLLAAIAMIALGACASSPPSRFYTLGSAQAPATGTATTSVGIGPVTIPGVVDRPEIVVTVGDNEVWLDEFNRWASPLGEAIAIAVAENVGAALGTPRVSAAAAADTDLRVAIEVQRFESVPGSHALLDALFTVRRTADGRALSGRTTAREAAGTKSYEALAAAHSRALDRLSRDIASTARDLLAQPARAAPPNR